MSCSTDAKKAGRPPIPEKVMPLHLCGALVLVALLLFAWAVPTSAQSYSFSIPTMMLHVYVNQDATVNMVHEIQFDCSPGAHAIDVVDIGLPHSGYDIGNMSATVDGQPLSGIKRSTYIGCGVEVPLGKHAIRAGQSGQFSFTCTMPDLVYQDTTDVGYASLRVTPTWFESGLLKGTTKLVITIYLPDEIRPEELKYQNQRNPYTKKGSLDSYTTAIWEMPGVRADRQHMAELSFPKRVVGGNVRQPSPPSATLPRGHGPGARPPSATAAVQMTPTGPLIKWWVQNPVTRVVCGALFFLLLGVAFFRASQQTGWCCLLGLSLVLLGLFVISPTAQLISFPVLLALWGLSEAVLRRRRRQYLPAIVSVEGGGVKRGFAAPEAAVLLELALSRVLTLVIFGLLKKSIVEQVKPEPLTVRVRPEYRTKTQAARRKMASRKGTVIHAYEHAFLDAIMDAGAAPVHSIDFSRAMERMIQTTADRMRGFDLKQTRAYYDGIVARAWLEADAISEADERKAHTDRELLWMLSSPDALDSFTRWHSHGFDYDPPWPRTGGGGTPASSPAVAPDGTAAPTQAAAPTVSVGDRTTFGDVASSFAGWIENVAGDIADHMAPVSVGADRGGLFSLAGVDRVSMQLLEALNESSGSGKGRGLGGGGFGGGFSCACACAGCACACACAGGGR